GLDDRARARLADAAPTVKAALPKLLEKFYDRLGQFEETRRMFTGPDHMASASRRQQEHWGAALSGQFDATYGRRARTVGAAHARIGLEPRWYIGGYAVMMENLVREVLEKNWKKGFGLGGGDRERTIETVGALIKAALLDMDLTLGVFLEEGERSRLALE